jgi:RNA polymerase sigma-70 factor (ECF subfamily)
MTPDWHVVIDRLRPFVARRVPPADVDDVVQDVLLRVHRNVGALRDHERFAPWLYQIARNAIVDHSRAKHDVPVPMPVPETHDPHAAPSAVPERLAAVLAFFVAQLPSPYREAITLTELEGMTQREAAARLGVSLPAIKSHVLRGRARLRALLEACCEIALDARGRPIECTPRQPCACAQS